MCAMSTSKTVGLGSVTDRDEFIIGEALATALIALEQLPKARQPTRNMADMKMLLNSLYAPPAVSLHLTTARFSSPVYGPSERATLSVASVEHYRNHKIGKTMTEPAEKAELIYENVD